MQEFWINTRDWMREAGFRTEVLSPFGELRQPYQDWQDMYSRDNYHLTQFAYGVLMDRVWPAVIEECERSSYQPHLGRKPELTQYTVESDRGHGSGQTLTVCLGNDGRRVIEEEVDEVEVLETREIRYLGAEDEMLIRRGGWEPPADEVEVADDQEMWEAFRASYAASASPKRTFPSNLPPA
jgi:hypothetical protein